MQSSRKYFDWSILYYRKHTYIDKRVPSQIRPVCKHIWNEVIYRGDIVNFALLLSLFFIGVILFYVFLPEKSRKQILRNNFTKIILSGTIVSLLLVNTEFLDSSLSHGTLLIFQNIS
jgi:hypothetical protein